MAMGEMTEDGNNEDSCPLILETSMVVPERECETGETEDGGGKVEDHTNVGNDYDAVVIDQRHRDSPTPILETSIVVPESQHETREMKGGGEAEFDEEAQSSKKGRTRRFGWKMIWPVFRAEWKLTRMETNRSNLTRKGADLVKTDQLSSIRSNTNMDGSQSSRKPII